MPTSLYISHSHTLKEEFIKYFDTRVFHEQDKWLIKEYCKPTSEGLKYVKSELKFMMDNDHKSLARVFCSFFEKWLGYTLGRYYKYYANIFIKKTIYT